MFVLHINTQKQYSTILGIHDLIICLLGISKDVF